MGNKVHKDEYNFEDDNDIIHSIKKIDNKIKIVKQNGNDLKNKIKIIDYKIRIVKNQLKKINKNIESSDDEEEDDEEESNEESNEEEEPNDDDDEEEEEDFYIVTEYGANSSANCLYAPKCNLFLNYEDAYAYFLKVSPDLNDKENEAIQDINEHNHYIENRLQRSGYLDGVPNRAKRPIGAVISKNKIKK
jgi:hypothetical protein